MKKLYNEIVSFVDKHSTRHIDIGTYVKFAFVKYYRMRNTYAYVQSSIQRKRRFFIGSSLSIDKFVTSMQVKKIDEVHRGPKLRSFLFCLEEYIILFMLNSFC